MPGYKVHLCGGVAAFFLVHTIMQANAYHQNYVSSLVFLSATLLGSLIPDLDISSKIQHFFYIIITGLLSWAIITQQWVFFMSASMLAIIITLVRHRTIFHSFLFLTIMPLLGILFFQKSIPLQQEKLLLLTIFFIVGTWSHLILDFGLKRFIKH